MEETEAQIGQRERTVIDLTAPEDIKYWTEQFGVSAEALAEAVQGVGSSVVAVEAHLKKSKA
jgi:hypothetical protein